MRDENIELAEDDLLERRLQNDEQRKRTHERLDAGENPLGGTNEALVVPRVVDRLMLKRASSW
eukprot:6434267-Amphidinium_carterae.1